MNCLFKSRSFLFIGNEYFHDAVLPAGLWKLNLLSFDEWHLCIGFECKTAKSFDYVPPLVDGGYKKEIMNESKLKDAIKNLTNAMHVAIAERIIRRPNRTYRQIAEDFGVSEATILLAAAKHGLSRPPGPKPAGLKEEQSHE
jgi:hypothetical protein